MSPDPPARSLKTDMLPRVLTAVIGISVVAAILLAGSTWPLIVLCALALVRAIHELDQVTLGGRKVAAAMAAWGLLAGAFMMLPVLLPYIGMTVGVATVGVAWLAGVAGLVAVALGKRHPAAQLLLGAWVGAPIATLAMLHVSTAEAPWFGWNLTPLLFAPIWIGDTAAYIAGTTLGRHKLAPKISPNKTWEGAAANFIGCMLGSYGIGILLSLPWEAIVAVGLITGVLGQVGDLLQSAIKRNAGLKDSGRILPGHGGLLDRLDSFFLTSTPALVALWLLAPAAFHVKP